MVEKSYSKKAIRNVIFNTTKNLISKFGGLIFTIILARLLLPELFGIYNLVLSVALITITFTDLGITQTMIRYVSEALGKDKIIEARSYLRYLIKIKSIITLVAMFLIVIFSKIIANQVFNKPILFYPILFSSIYILINSIYGILVSILYSENKLEKIPFAETIFQFSKIILATIAITILSNNYKIQGVFIGMSIALLFSCIYLIVSIIKRNKKLIHGKIIKIKKPKINKYLGYMSIASISLVFFGAIDTIMLGRFVDATYIGIYRAALGLILTVGMLLAISNSLLPIFTQVNKLKLQHAGKKLSRYMLIVAIPATVGMIMLREQIILAVYGIEFIAAAKVIVALSPLIITFILTSLYSNILQAKEDSKSIAKNTIIALIANIIMNSFVILKFANISQELTIIGVGISTVISRTIYLILLKRETNKKIGFKIEKKPIFKSIIASGMMGIFLFNYSNYFELNILSGLFEIIIATIIYFVIMYLLKGITKEDFKLIKK
jgi:stage V sporulation protein B